MKKSLSLLVAMREIYGQPPLSNEAAGAYFEALRDLPDEEVAKVLGECLKFGSRMPLPSEIREVVRRRMRDAAAAEPTAQGVA